MKPKHKIVITMLFFIVIIIVIVYIGGRYIPTFSEDESWITDFGYDESEIHTLSFNWAGDRSCPEIPIKIENDIFNIGFDTGCGSGIFFTDAIEDKINYTLIGEVEQLNRDGSHRGWSKSIILDKLNLFGDDYKNIETTIANWNMFSSEKFNGTIGLAYFKSKTVTLDYAGHKIAVSNNPINYDHLDLNKYVVLPLYKSTNKGQENLPFFKAELNGDGEEIIVYLDTGKNYSYIYNSNSEYAIGEKPREFLDIPIIIGDIELVLKDISEVNNLAQASGLPYPTMIELNSDQIWKNNLLVTFDLIEQKIIFRK